MDGIATVTEEQLHPPLVPSHALAFHCVMTSSDVGMLILDFTVFRTQASKCLFMIITVSGIQL